LLLSIFPIGVSPGARLCLGALMACCLRRCLRLWLLLCCANRERGRRDQYGDYGSHGYFTTPSIAASVPEYFLLNASTSASSFW
jgi:hypothetical protein